MNTIARRSNRREWLLEYARFRELFFFLVWRDIKIRYKQTVLGAAWAVIQPFFMMVIFSIFFGRVAGLDSEGVPYPVFSYAALLPWTYFQNSVSLSGNSLIANSKLISKVYFPRAIIPSSSALSGLVDFAIAYSIVIGMMLYYNISFSWGMLLWIPLLLPLLMLVLGFGMFFSALNVKYRDIKYAIPFFLQALLFLSPVIYSTDSLPETIRRIQIFNPLTGIINAFRASLLPNKAINFEQLGISIAITIVIFIIGATYFRKTERAFADLI